MTSSKNSKLGSQPVSSVEWVDGEILSSNDYNPNHVAPPELNLLKISILEDGWTQPIVIRDGNEIVDGFHRWTLSQQDPEVRALTGGLVPVVRLKPANDPGHQRMSTIRHNRARGRHGVVPMAHIVIDLINEYGLSHEEVGYRLRMEGEEIKRLVELGNMRERGSATEYENAWKPR